MKPYNDSLKKVLYREITSPGVVGNFDYFSSVLTCDPMNKGDHERPTSWHYKRVTSKKFDGAANAYAGNYGGGYFGALTKRFVGPLQNLGDVDVNVHLGTLHDKAYNRALGKLNEQVRGELDISVALAEAHQTQKMVNAVGKFERYFQSVGPRRWGNEWLELHYGWKPLLGDIYGAAEELIALPEFLAVISARAHAKADTTVSTTTSGPVDISGLSNFTDLPVTTKSKISVFDGVKLQISLKPPTDLVRLGRWTSLNPVNIAWELVPYSFVVDWFIDIGTFLRDTESYWLYNSLFSSGYRSDLRAATVTSTVLYANFIPNYFERVDYINAKANQDVLSFDRDLLYSYPFPRLPQVNTDLSSSRLITAAALLGQHLPAPESVKRRWMDLARPFIPYGELKKPKFRFKPQQNWSNELKW